MSETIDLTKLSKEDLAAEIKRRDEAEQKKQRKAKDEFRADNDAFVKDTVAKFNQLHDTLKQLKDTTILRANELYVRMYELEGKEPKEQKSFSRISEDGQLKITVDRQERFAFTDEAEVHIQAIRDIFKNKFQDRHKGFYNILDGILMKGNKGDYDPRLLAKARKQVRELNDDELIKQFDKLDECQRVDGTSLYARAYQKNEHGKWKDIVINFSSL